jgi:hypothetical protein
VDVDQGRPEAGLPGRRHYLLDRALGPGKLYGFEAFAPPQIEPLEKGQPAEEEPHVRRDQQALGGTAGHHDRSLSLESAGCSGVSVFDV